MDALVEANGIAPFVVNYETLTGDPAAVVSSIVELLGVQSDKAQTVDVAVSEKPADRISEQWAARFEREILSGIKLNDAGAAKIAKPRAARAKHEPGASHVFDRYNAIIGTVLHPPAARRQQYVTVTT